MTEIEIEALRNYVVSDAQTRSEYHEHIPGLAPAFNAIESAESNAKKKIYDEFSVYLNNMMSILNKLTNQ